MPVKKYLNPESIVAKIQDGTLTDTSAKIVETAYETYANVTLPNLRTEGLTYDQIVEQTELSRYTVQLYLASEKPHSTTWGVAYQMASLYGQTVSKSEQRDIMAALNNVQTTIIRFVTSPLPTSALLTRYGAPELHMGRSSFDRARKRINGDLEANNPIWSMRVNKVLLLYVTLKHDTYFLHRDSVLRKALETVGNDWKNRKELIIKLLNNPYFASYESLAEEIDVYPAVLYKWKRMTDEEWQTYNLRADILINIWDYLYPID